MHKVCSQNHLRCAVLALVVVWSAACGQTPSEVYVPADVGPDTLEPADVSVADVPVSGKDADLADVDEPDADDAPTDVAADAKPDAKSDANPNVKPDVALDAGDVAPADVPDVAPPVDVWPDVAGGGDAPDANADADDAVDVAVDASPCVPACGGANCDDGCGGNCGGQPCDDADPCTTGDSCVALTCSGTAVGCDDGNVCTVDACDSLTGTCAHAADDLALPTVGSCLPAPCQTVTASCAGGVVLCTAATDTSADAAACPGGKCASGACLPAECTPGTATCAANATQLCDDLGFWGKAGACAAKSSCAFGACQPWLCQPNAATCAGQIRSVCDALGLAFAVTQDCAASAEVCDNGTCVPPVCTPGAIDCGNASVRVCLPSALGYAQTPCPDGFDCAAGVCLEKICAPGAFSCVGKTVVQCDAKGLDFSTTADCAANGQTCQGGACVAPNCTATDNACKGKDASHCSADGLTLSATTCDAWQSCQDGLCVNLRCTPGKSVCQGETVVTCDAVGLASNATPDCSDSGQVCWQGACMPVICTPGDGQCVDGIPQTCNAKGAGWNNGVCATGQLCIGKTCQTAVCKAGELYCQGSVVATCTADGQGGTAVENCAVSGKACANGACLVVACLPGAKSCDSGHLLTCKSDATGWWVDTCDDGYACTTDGCDPAMLACVHPAMVCEDGNPCTADTCMYGKCVGAWGDMQPCSDANACTPLDFCFQGQCQSHGAGAVVTIAGSGSPGHVDGLEAVATFNHPRGMAEMADGSILIADMDNHCIRRWIPGKSVTTFAGSGFAGFMEGDANLAQFKSPTGVAVGPDGVVYVADSGNFRIRKIKDGLVSTFSGTGTTGHVDGPANKAQYAGMAAMHMAPDGYLWLATSYYLVRIAMDGSATTFMGGGGYYQNAGPAVWQVADVPPQDFAFAPDGSIFVSIYYNYPQIYRISPQMAVSVAFDAGGYMVVDKQGTIWFQDEGNLYRGETGGSYGLYAGVWSGGFADGVFTAGLIGSGARMLLTSDGTWLLADTVNHALRKVNRVMAGCDDGNGCTVDVCQADGTCGHGTLADGATCTDGNSCTQGDICTAGICATGTLLNCADGNECTDDGCDPWTGQCAHTQSIRPCTAGDACNLAMVCSAGTCGPGPAMETTRVGGATVYGDFIDGTALDARFAAGMGGMVRQSDGGLLVADTGNAALRRIAPDDVVTTWGNKSGTLGDGPVGSVGTGKPLGVAVDRRGSVYFTSYGQIGRILQGQSTIWCGTGAVGLLDGACAGAKFNAPAQLAFATDGTLYVADTGNHVLRAISASGVVSTAAGTGTQGYVDGPIVSAQLDAPQGVAVGLDGSVFFSDAGAKRIRKLKNGVVSTIAGGGSSLASPSLTSQLALLKPSWLSVDFSGALYVSDSTRLWRIAASNATQILGNVPTYSSGYITDGATTTAQQVLVGGTVPNGDGSVEFVDDRTVRHLTAYVRTCDDGNGCTADSCAAKTGACGHAPFADASACSDGDACSTADACANGACIGSVVSCDDGEPCTVDNCNPYSAICEHIVRPGFCDDGDICTGAEACLNGTCTSQTAMVVHLAGTSQGENSFADGDAWLSRFQNASEGCSDAAGNVYIADSGNNRVRKVAPDGTTTTVAGNGAAGSDSSGPALSVGLGYVQGIACNAKGLLAVLTSYGLYDYVADVKTGAASLQKRCGTASPTVIGVPGVGALESSAWIVGLDDGSVIATNVTSNYSNFYYVYTAEVYRIWPDGSVAFVSSGATKSGWYGVARGPGDVVHAVDTYGNVYRIFPGPLVGVGSMGDGAALATSPQGSVYSLIAGALLRFDPATGLTVTIAANGSKANDPLLGSADLKNWRVIAAPGANRVVIGYDGELRHIIRPVNNCDDGNPCTLDTCDPATGACSHGEAMATCDDGNACTTSDTCSGGKCGGVPLVCASTQTCVAGACTTWFAGTQILGISEQATLNLWVGLPGDHNWQKCFGGPLGAGAAETLFSACNGKGPSYTVIATVDPVNPGVVHHFGAYQSGKWMTSASSGVNVYAQDAKAFLFSLDKNADLKMLDPFGGTAYWGFYLAANMPGPKFGNSDIVINSSLSAGMMNLGDSYDVSMLPCGGGLCKGWFAGTTAFTIQQLEVFYGP